MNISILDLVVLIFYVLAIIHGYKKGLVLSLALLIGLALGTWGAKKFSGLVSEWMYKNWEIQVNNLAFFITFIGILILVFLLGKALEKSLSLLMLGWANKAGGILFALAKASIILIVSFHFYQELNLKYHFTSDSDFSISKAYPILTKANEWLFPIIEKFKPI